MVFLSAFISALNWRIVDFLNGHKNGEYETAMVAIPLFSGALLLNPL